MSCATCVAPVPTPELFTDWANHPRFPSQTLLLGSHANFRHLSAKLYDQAQRRAHEPSWRRYATSLFSRWQSAMGGHEHYEEYKLYPYLSRRFQVSTGVLQGDHRQLHTLADAVTSALYTGNDAQVAFAFGAYDAALNEHLDREEELVIPLLLAMEPAEFERFTSSGIRQLLADIDDCDKSGSR